MMPPTLACWRFGIACLLGILLGLLYGFLRPLRPKYTLLGDTLFLLGVSWAWLYLALAVCGGDLRFGYSLGLPIGGVLCEMTVGRLLRPIYFFFWRMIRQFFRAAAWPAKKLLHF